MTVQKNAPAETGARGLPRSGLVGGARKITKQKTTTEIDVQAIKDAIDPAEYYRHELATMPPPRRTGWVCGGLCPFHLDQKAGSFRVNTQTGAFHCFSCGVSGGDLLDYIILRDGVDFVTALRELAPGILPEHIRSTGKLPARDALKALEFEASLVEIAASALARGESISEKDLKRLHIAARRVRNVLEVI